MSHQPDTDLPRVTVPGFQALARSGRRLVMTTAYDAVTARLADPVVDAILVGDSVGNVCLGFETTLPVSVAMMNHHLEAVARTGPRALLVADMPFLTYQLGPEEALRAAGGFLQRGAAAVKLEGARHLAALRALLDAEIPVMGHVGLTPQSVHAMGGYRVQGRGAAEADRLVEDALRLQEAGCFALVVEGVPAELGRRLTEAVAIPTIGIGAGPHCSGQVLVLHDVLGLVPGRKPRFVRAYADGFGSLQAALGRWAEDVRAGTFPSGAESYHSPEAPRGALATLPDPAA